MESNYFRCLARGLARRLPGVRLQKIFQPAVGAHTFSLRGPALSEHLLFRPHRQLAALFLSHDKPPNPLAPDAQTMWLRRRAGGRMIQAVRVDWPGRRLALEFAPSEEREGRFLVLDMVRGPMLVELLDAGFDEEPDWPTLAEVLSDEDTWRRHPQVSPPLRQTLTALDPAGARELWRAIREGRCERFFILLHEDKPRACLPFPPAEAKGEVVECADALEAARLYGERLLFPELQRLAEAPQAEALKSRAKQLKKLLKKLDTEEERLRDMDAGRAKALGIQGNLYALDAEAKLAEVEVMDAEGRMVRIDLDPSLSVAENMTQLFARAAKGRRGVERLKTRREEVRAELAGLERGVALPPSQPKTRSGKTPPPGKTRGQAAKESQHKGLAVSRFRTSDGFTVLRGKNAKANHQLLDKVNAFDLWFHAQDVPGAHVVLRRDHPSQEAPEESRRQAAILAGLKSGYATEDKARVMCALVKDVRKIKGAAHGQVRVDALLESLLVTLDPELEIRLSIDGEA